jgi:integrase
MSYYVRKSGKAGWSLTKQYFEKGKKRQKAVPKSSYHTVGLRDTMTIEQARERIVRLNKEKSIDKWKAIRAANRAKEIETLDSVYLPGDLAKDFQQWLVKNYGIEEATRKKLISHWKRAQHLIKEIELHPHQFYSNRKAIYRYFSKKGYSLDYSKKVLRILNQYGEYICEYQGEFFRPVPRMTSSEANSIRDSYHDSSSYIGPSDFLTPQMLEKIMHNLKPEQYRWLYISVWLGLRPKEVDNLHRLKASNKLRYKLEKKNINGSVVNVISIYQSKLSSVSRENRWKHIPLFLPEQKKVLSFLKQEFRRPLNKTLKKLTNKKITCYSGRKGFTDLMLDKNQELVNISAWLGHSSIEMTWKKYPNKERLDFKKVS